MDILVASVLASGWEPYQNIGQPHVFKNPQIKQPFSQTDVTILMFPLWTQFYDSVNSKYSVLAAQVNGQFRVISCLIISTKRGLYLINEVLVNCTDVQWMKIHLKWSIFDEVSVTVELEKFT